MTVEATARKAYGILEPLVAMIYFVPEGPTNYEKLGLKPRQGYFCSRSAALGAVPGEVVAATFYNFNPAIVIPLVDEGWKITTPQATAEARNQAVVEALTHLIAEEDGTVPDVSRAVALSRKATANLKMEGRPLFAAHQAQPWPESNDLLSLWWGANLLREFRGDGHIAALLANDISGLEAMLMAIGWSELAAQMKTMLFKTRVWSDEQMAEAYKDLEARGLMQGETLTEAGRALRDSIEETTDKLAVAPWRNLGDEAEEYLDLIKPLTKRILERGGLGVRR